MKKDRTKGKGKAQVSQDELQQAIEKYLRQGGRIRRLPDQKVAANTLVGGKWSSTEIDQNQPF